MDSPPSEGANGRGRYPNGKRFAFTVIDDTDVATVANVRPIYDLLQTLGFRTTKTVWPLACPEGSRNYQSSQTLQDPDYKDFILRLRRAGFEIASHGATMESSLRERTARGLQVFADTFGGPPRVHANHGHNKENLYWGASRFDARLLGVLYEKLSGLPPGYFSGHVEGSPYWWGDLCAQHIQYVRNLTFDTIDVLDINPTIPYRDPRRPLVRRWFSACDAEEVTAFNDLLSLRNQERLERRGGVCIVATHFGKGFVRDGVVSRATVDLLERLARRPGWFVPVGELLDWLDSQRSQPDLPRHEWSRMQRRWFTDLVLRRIRRALRRLKQ